MENAVQPAPDQNCPEFERLQRWLDGRIELADSERHHVSGCEQCNHALETLTEAADLRRFADPDNDGVERYAGEPELQLLRSNMAGAIHRQDLDSTLRSLLAARTTDDSNQDRSRLSILDLQQRLPGDRYRLERFIASGGAGSVFMAFDIKLRRSVAIKILIRETSHDRQRLLREAKILSEIEHSNVVRLFDIGTLKPASASLASSPSLLYLVMDYVSGGTIAETNSNRSFRDIARLLSQAAAGISAAHARDLVHRDIKPSNLLVDADGQHLRVADFGLARGLESDETQVTNTGDILGTPQFMSPEQVRAESIGPLSDVYSLGATLYRLITDQPPFSGNTAAVLRQVVDANPVAPRILNPNIPADLETVCLRAMEKQAENRYASMQDFGDDLQRFVNGQPVHARPLSVMQRAYRWSFQYPVLAGAIGLTTFLAACLFVVSVMSAIVFRQQNRRLVEAAASERAAKLSAEKSLNASIDAADQLLISVARDARLLPRTPGSQLISQQLLERARDYYAAFLTANSDNENLKYQLARAHSGLAEIASQTSDVKAVQAATDAALGFLDELPANAVSPQKIAEQKADTLTNLANVLFESGEVQAALQAYDRATDVIVASFAKGLESEGLLASQGSVLRGQANALVDLGKREEAMELLQKSKQIYERLRQEHPLQPAYLRDAASADLVFATTAIDRNELSEGKQHLLDALQLLEKVDAKDAIALRARELKALAQTNLGLAERRMGNTQAAKAAYDAAIEENRRLIELEPSVQSHSWNLVVAVLNSGGPELDLGNLEPLVERWRQVIPVLDQLIVAEPDNMRYVQVQAMLHSNIAIVLRDLGKLEEAIEPLQSATKVLRDYSRKLDDAPQAYLPVATNYLELARTYTELNRYSDALEALDASDKITNSLIALDETLLPAHSHALDSMLARCKVLTAMQPVPLSMLRQVSQTTLELAEELAREQPDFEETLWELPQALIARGLAELESGEIDAAAGRANEAAQKLAVLSEKNDSPVVRNTQKQAALLDFGVQLARESFNADALAKSLDAAIEEAKGFGASDAEINEFRRRYSTAPLN